MLLLKRQRSIFGTRIRTEREARVCESLTGVWPLNGVFGSGLRLLDQDIPEAMRTGWLHNHLISSLLREVEHIIALFNTTSQQLKVGNKGSLTARHAALSRVVHMLEPFSPLFARQDLRRGTPAARKPNWLLSRSLLCRSCASVGDQRAWFQDLG